MLSQRIAKKNTEQQQTTQSGVAQKDGKQKQRKKR
jgi:hypothetical protein